MIKKKLMIQQKTDSSICRSCTTAKMLQCLPTGEVSTIVSPYYDDVLKKRFSMLLVISSLLSTNFGSLN